MCKNTVHPLWVHLWIWQVLHENKKLWDVASHVCAQTTHVLPPLAKLSCGERWVSYAVAKTVIRAKFQRFQLHKWLKSAFFGFSESGCAQGSPSPFDPFAFSTFPHPFPSLPFPILSPPSPSPPFPFPPLFPPSPFPPSIASECVSSLIQPTSITNCW